jgi:folate-dependent phosphoribosylglycinamide formyltransferase PurN
MNKHKLLILATEGISTNILYNSLEKEYNIEAIILEQPVARKQFLKKRIKKLGAWTVLGQILFQFSVVPFLNFFSSTRKREILDSYNLDDSPLPKNKIVHINSVNSPECNSLIKKINPELILVNGTRIISKEVLESAKVKFLNIHAGITPKYRNVHGGYWAIVNNDLGNCGVTVHLVDKGIDTGNIIYQQVIPVSEKDNFVTYPLLQIAEGIIILKKALADIFENKLSLKSNNLESRLWYHPTIWQYMYFRLFRKKK